MSGYLLDTDIVVFLLRNLKGIAQRLSAINPKDVYISEVTVAELEYGNYCSGRYEENKLILDQFLSFVNVIPFSEAVSLYAKERHRLRKAGQSIEDFDLLIGCTSATPCGYRLRCRYQNSGRVGAPPATSFRKNTIISLKPEFYH